MKGYRTIAVGAAMAVLPPLVTYLLGIDWTSIVGANAAMVISGVLTIGMRLVTTTPAGQKN